MCCTDPCMNRKITRMCGAPVPLFTCLYFRVSCKWLLTLYSAQSIMQISMQEHFIVFVVLFIHLFFIFEGLFLFMCIGVLSAYMLLVSCHANAGI